MAGKIGSLGGTIGQQVGAFQLPGQGGGGEAPNTWGLSPQEIADADKVFQNDTTAQGSGQTGWYHQWKVMGEKNRKWFLSRVPSLSGGTADLMGQDQQMSGPSTGGLKQAGGLQ